MSNEKRLWIIEARDGAWGANGICKGELVRCKDCKYWNEFIMNRKPQGYGLCTLHEITHKTDTDWFCADGERSEEP